LFGLPLELFILLVVVVDIVIVAVIIVVAMKKVQPTSKGKKLSKQCKGSS